MTNSKTALDHLLRTARRNDPTGAAYGEDPDSLDIPEGLETLTAYKDYTPGEVQIVALERNRKGEIARVLLWDGIVSAPQSPWSIDDDLTPAKLRHLGVRGVGRPAESTDGAARDVELRVRLSAAEKARIEELAKSEDMDVSTYVRGKVL